MANFLETDVIFVGSQECGTSIYRSICCGINKQWNKKLISLLRPTHLPIISDFMSAIHSVVFVKKKFCLFPQSRLRSPRK